MISGRQQVLMPTFSMLLSRFCAFADGFYVFAGGFRTVKLLLDDRQPRISPVLT
jgi:hypothetical protein